MQFSCAFLPILVLQFKIVYPNNPHLLTDIDGIKFNRFTQVNSQPGLFIFAENFSLITFEAAKALAVANKNTSKRFNFFIKILSKNLRLFLSGYH